MSSNTILTKILNLLAVDKNELVELTRNVVYGSLVPDNEILEVSEWKIGVPVFIISEDGSKKPMKDGDYEVVIEDVAAGRADGGPTKYAMKIEGSKIESLQIKQLRETKSETNKTQLSSMEEKATVPGTETPEKEMMADPLKDLPSEEKYATKAEIEEIKKALKDLTDALNSLTKESSDEEMGSEEKTAKVPETKTPNMEELGSYEKSVSVPETKVPSKSETKKVKFTSARQLTGAPEVEKPNYSGFFNNEKSYESTRDRVWRRINS
jgi:hypothetical protein